MITESDKPKTRLTTSTSFIQSRLDRPRYHEESVIVEEGKVQHLELVLLLLLVITSPTRTLILIATPAVVTISHFFGPAIEHAVPGVTSFPFHLRILIMKAEDNHCIQQGNRVVLMEPF